MRWGRVRRVALRPERPFLPARMELGGGSRGLSGEIKTVARCAWARAEVHLNTELVVALDEGDDGGISRNAGLLRHIVGAAQYRLNRYALHGHTDYSELFMGLVETIVQDASLSTNAGTGSFYSEGFYARKGDNQAGVAQMVEQPLRKG